MGAQTAGGLLTAILLWCAGCASWSQDCGGVEMVSRVGVVPERSVEIVEFCLDGECSRSGSGRDVVLAVDDEPVTYDFRLVISVADDEQPATEGALSTEEHFVNGKGCEPRTANATLTVDAGGGLAIAHP